MRDLDNWITGHYGDDDPRWDDPPEPGAEGPLEFDDRAGPAAQRINRRLGRQRFRTRARQGGALLLLGFALGLGWAWL